MRPRLVVVVAVLAALAVSKIREGPWANSTARLVEQRGPLSDAERANIDIFERVSPSIIQVAAQSAANPFSEGGASSGTGFVWDNDGDVVTNNHVVQRARAVAVRFASGRMARTTLVGTAPNHDLAVLRITGARTLPPPVGLGSSADLKVGQWAFAIGNPFGLDQPIISALNRRLFRRSAAQFRRKANRRDHGDPLAVSVEAGIGFAIPIDIINRVVPELIRNGGVSTPGIGIVASNEAVATPWAPTA